MGTLVFDLDGDSRKDDALALQAKGLEAITALLGHEPERVLIATLIRLVVVTRCCITCGHQQASVSSALAIVTTCSSC